MMMETEDSGVCALVTGEATVPLSIPQTAETPLLSLSDVIFLLALNWLVLTDE